LFAQTSLASAGLGAFVVLGLVTAGPNAARADAFELPPQLVDSNAPVVELTGAWRAQAGDDLAWADPAWDDSGWIKVPASFGRRPSGLQRDRAAWYRAVISVPEALVGREVVVGCTHYGSLEVFIDGQRVVQRGDVDAARSGGRTAAFGAPRASGHLRFERPGEHVVAVRYASGWHEVQQRIGALTGFRLMFGPAEAFEATDRATEARMGVHLWFFGGTLFLSFLYFCLYAFGRDRRENLHFAVSSLAVGLVALSVRGTFFSETVFRELAFLTLFRFSIVWASYSYLRFAQELLFSARPRRTWVYLAVAAVLSLGAPWVRLEAYYVFSLAMVMDCAVVLVLGVLTRQPGARLVALGGFCTVLSVFIQLVPPLVGVEPQHNAFVWGFALNYVVLAYVLARNYTRARDELAEQMTLALQHERQAKEEALARRELEAENARQDMQLEEARKREVVLAQLERANHELKATQAQLVQSGKMAALGQLVAGVAHEINTPTGAIRSMHQSLDRAIGMLRSELSAAHPEVLADGHRIQKAIEVLNDASSVIGTGSERVTEIVRRLRTFARLDEANFKLADLNEGLRDTLMLVAHRRKLGTELIEDLSHLPKIPCFPSQLNQVFLNLLVNAMQAIEGAGRVTVRSRGRPNAVEVEVEDDGVGIPPEHIERIFDPGFTTKGVRVGTGLGLSISYQIIQEHHGRIDVQSQVGEGSRFTVTVPADLDVRLGRKPEVPA